MDSYLTIALVHVVLCSILCAVQIYMFENNGDDGVQWLLSIVFLILSIPFYMMLDTSVGYIFNKIVGG